MCLLRSHEMNGDSAEVGYQGIAVDQWLVRVSDVECDALAGKADAYCKVDVARRQRRVRSVSSSTELQEAWE
jgi:hypothetical protein